jgi:hypothetical protein
MYIRLSQIQINVLKISTYEILARVSLCKHNKMVNISCRSNINNETHLLSAKVNINCLNEQLNDCWLLSSFKQNQNSMHHVICQHSLFDFRALDQLRKTNAQNQNTEINANLSTKCCSITYNVFLYLHRNFTL